MIKSLHLILTGIILSVTGSILLFLYNPPVKKLTINIPDVGRALLYYPRETGGRLPCVILIRGVCSSEEIMETYGVEIASTGSLAISPHFSTDNADDQLEIVLKVLAYAAARPDVDPGRLGLVGYSLGGHVAAEAVYKVPGVISAATFGMYVNGDLAVDYKDFLVSCGVFDTLHPPSELLYSIRSLSGCSAARPGELYGDFSRNNARMLIVSPLSDHSGEIADPLLLSGITKWLIRSFGMKSENYRERISFLSIGWAALLAGLFLVMPYGILTLTKLWRIHLRLAAAMVLILCLAAGYASAHSLIDPGLGVAFAALLSISLAITAHFSLPAQSGSFTEARYVSGVLRLSAFVVFFGTGYIISQLFHLRDLMIREGVPPWAFPLHVWFNNVVTPFYVFLCNQRALFAGSSTWIPLACWSFVPLVELIRPGLFGRVSNKLPATLSLKFRGRTNLPSLGILGICIAAAGISWWTVFARGPINKKLFIFYLTFIWVWVFYSILLPGVICYILIAFSRRIFGKK